MSRDVLIVVIHFLMSCLRMHLHCCHDLGFFTINKSYRSVRFKKAKIFKYYHDLIFTEPSFATLFK